MTQMPSTSFDERKAAEVAYFFLSKAAARGMNITKLRLVKWFYLAERLSYEKYGEPIIGDRLFSMKHGPVVSTTLYLMEHPEKVLNPTGEWGAVVARDADDRSSGQKRHQHAVISETCPYKSEDDLVALSDSEIELLRVVWNEYGHMSSQALETLLHDSIRFPEWQWRPGEQTNPIQLEKLFQVMGYSESQITTMVDKIKSMQAVGRAFAH